MKILSLYMAAVVILFLGISSAALANESEITDEDTFLITSGDPSDPTFANAGENLRTGVGSIFVSFVGTGDRGFLCSMAVIGDRHLLTAAHCMRNTNRDGSPDTVDRIVVILPSGVSYRYDSNLGQVTGFTVNGFFDLLSQFGFGAFAAGDVAVIELAENLPDDVERYELYRAADEFGEETRHYGHGRSGTGYRGATGGASFIIARTGLNSYEQTLAPLFGNLFPFLDQLLHDYDSGGRKHNAMEWWFTSQFACSPEIPDNPSQSQDGQCTAFKDGSYPDFKGYGKLEVGVAPGDSGGPGFIDGKIAGVHSFGFTHLCSGSTNGTDFSCGLNSSYGEMFGDTRISTEAPWIDAAVAGLIPATPIPEPAAATAAATASEPFKFELSAHARSFMANTLSRRLRAPMTWQEFEAKFGNE